MKRAVIGFASTLLFASICLSGLTPLTPANAQVVVGGSSGSTTGTTGGTKNKVPPLTPEPDPMVTIAIGLAGIGGMAFYAKKRRLQSGR